MEVVHGEVFEGIGVVKREALVELYLFERVAVSSITSEESSAMPFRGTRHAVSRHSRCPSDEPCPPRRRDDCGALSVARGVAARVGLRERPLLALRPRAESGLGRPFCARHCLSTRRGALLRGLGPDQTFFQDRPTFFLSFARSQPNFRETFAKVAMLAVRAIFLGLHGSRR